MLLAVALSALLQVQGELDCRLRVGLSEAEIGQPIACELIVSHPLGTRVNVDLESLAPNDGWIVLDEPKLLTTRHTYDNQPAAIHTYYGSITTVEWTLAALEPGAHTVVAPAVMCEIDGVAENCADSSHAVAVLGALAEGEDAPRPPARPELPSSEAEGRYVSAWWLLAPPVGLVLIALAWRFARRERAVPVVTGPSARASLAALDLELPAPEYCGLLRGHLRDAVDERARLDRRGLTDDEWLAACGADPETIDRLRTLLATCEAVRFGGERPTRWALETLRDEALGVLPRDEALGVLPHEERAA